MSVHFGRMFYTHIQFKNIFNFTPNNFRHSGLHDGTTIESRSGILGHGRLFVHSSAWTTDRYIQYFRLSHGNFPLPLESRTKPVRRGLGKVIFSASISGKPTIVALNVRELSFIFNDLIFFLNFSFLFILRNFRMKLTLFTITNIFLKTEGGNFFDEMTKFKNGLNERPQTYRKIVVSDGSTGGSKISTSCCGREVSASNLNFDDAKKYCADLNKKLAGTVYKFVKAVNIFNSTVLLNENTDDTIW